MHAKYEVSVSYSSKVIAKVKVDNRQTNKQTDSSDSFLKIVWMGTVYPSDKNQWVRTQIQRVKNRNLNDDKCELKLIQ